MKVCIVGASGKLGRYMVRHALGRGHEVVGVCRPASVAKLDGFAGRIALVPGCAGIGGDYPLRAGLFVTGFAGIRVRRRELPATSCGMHAGCLVV